MNQEETEQIKKQLLEQLENLQVENKEQIKESIKLMNQKQLEDFLKQNKIQYKITGKEQQTDQQTQSPQQAKKGECIFCSIIEGKIQAYKIDENKKSLAILEINPLSKGHILIISKEHNKLPNQALTLANKIAKKLKSKLRPKPEEVKIENGKMFGHEIVNVIPIYKNEKLERKKAYQKELILLQNKLEKKQGKKTTNKKKPITTTIKLPKAPIRIP